MRKCGFYPDSNGKLLKSFVRGLQFKKISLCYNMKNGLDPAKMVVAVTKLQVRCNGGLIYARKAETEKTGYI